MSFKKESLIISVALALMSLGVWGHGFVRDDFIFFNAHDTDLSPRGLLELSKRTYFHEIGEQDIFYYRPLSRAFYRLENLLFQGGLAGYHAMSLCIYLLWLLSLNSVLKPWVPAGPRLWGLLWIGFHPAAQSFWVYMTGVIDTLSLLFTAWAILAARRSGGGAVAAALALSLLSTLAKESGILSFPIVAFVLWSQGRGRAMGGFLAGGALLAGGYLALRSQVAATPGLGSWGNWVPLVVALGRESFWTPLLLLARPDLCHMENHVLASFPHDGIFLALTGLVWGGVAVMCWRCRSRTALPLAALFLMYWMLSIPNAIFSIELSTAEFQVHLLYLPDHLMVVPLMCLVFPMTRALAGSRTGMGILALVTLVTMGVSASKVGEWRDEMSLFKAIVAHEPPVSRPYRVLALRQMESGDLEGASATLNAALRRGFKNSELYHQAAVLAGRMGDTPTRDHMLAEGARQGIVESMLELQVILRGPTGKEKAAAYLRTKQRLFPNEKWFKIQEKVLK